MSGILPKGLQGWQVLRALGQPSSPPAEDRWGGRGEKYQVGPATEQAVMAAVVLRAPLLVTGEPGVGKTDLAYWAARHFELNIFRFDVRSTTTYKDLLYTFDTVAYFHQAQNKDQALDKKACIKKGPLWQALSAPSVLLIDEVDKAPRDFPNDLLRIFEDNTFEIPEYPDLKPTKASRPLLVVTSNGERPLPDAFLRRCLYHPLSLDKPLVREAVLAKRGSYGELDDAYLEAAQERFWSLREEVQRKKPSTAELLLWLMLLSADTQRPPAEILRQMTLDDLPHKGVLLKTSEDYPAPNKDNPAQ